ncbi:hypothetical protein I4U23_023138 [Adineta vaga]|nr:hypothetical protein I4U23_023138 [Adineta vaga]
MSMNTTTSNIVSSQISNTVIVLNILSKNYVVHLPLILIIFGVIGFIGNALTYLQSELRSNPCCIYSFCSSIADIINLIYNLLPSYLSGAYGIYIPWFRLPNMCKFFIFCLGFIPHLSINFLLMSIIDRYACTCSLTSRIRRLNQIKMVPWLIIITILTSFISSIRTLILYEYRTGRGCVATNTLLNNILYAIINGTIQPVTMLIFVLLTFRNVHKSRQRVAGMGISQSHRTRNQFISLILVQILVTGIISLQWIIMYLYYLIPVTVPRTSEQQTIVNFIYSLSNCCYYLNNVKSFYLSIATSHLFRQTFIKALIRLLPRNQRQRWQLTQTNVQMMTLTKINPHRIT